MQQHPKTAENPVASALGDVASELVGGLAEYFIVPILFALLIAGVVFLCLYVFRRLFGRANAPLVPPNKDPRPFPAPHSARQLRNGPWFNS